MKLGLYFFCFECYNIKVWIIYEIVSEIALEIIRKK